MAQGFTRNPGASCQTGVPHSRGSHGKAQVRGVDPSFVRMGAGLGSRKRSILPLAALLACCLLLSACKPVGPNYSKPGYSAPTNYKETGAASVVPPPRPCRG